jgi:hypothetical protein
LTKFKAGDVVTRPDWGLDVNGRQFVAVIEQVDDKLFRDDPVAFFVGGGFWRTSRLLHADATAQEMAKEQKL